MTYLALFSAGVFVGVVAVLLACRYLDAVHTVDDMDEWVEKNHADVKLHQLDSTPRH